MAKDVFSKVNWRLDPEGALSPALPMAEPPHATAKAMANAGLDTEDQSFVSHVSLHFLALDKLDSCVAMREVKRE